MMHTNKGALPSSSARPLIVDLTGRIKKNTFAPRARRAANSAPAATTIYMFPPRRVNPPRSESNPPAPSASRRPPRLPSWIKSVTAWHGLIAGALACYVLIVCNLVYGLTSMSQLKVWRPLQNATLSEFQRRALTTPAECERDQAVSGGAAGVVPLASVLCSADKTFAGVLDDLFPRALAREPRALRVY